MEILITDANIFIDLLDLDAIHYLFSTGHEIHTTTAVIAELDAEQQKILMKFQDILMHQLSIEDIQQLAHRNYPNALSFTDQTVIYLTERVQGILLTGDGRMRRFALSRGMQVHGILWLFEVFVGQDILTRHQAADLLGRLKEINERLPMGEVERLIGEWKAD